jgi:hypothetical protein
LRDTIWAFGSWIHTNVFHVEYLLLYARLNRGGRGGRLEIRYVIYTTTIYLHVTKSPVDTGNFFYPFQFSPLAPYADFAMTLRTADIPRQE